jgi:polar amino acid transport system permease protein
MEQVLHYFFNFASLNGYWDDIAFAFGVTVLVSIQTLLLGIPLGFLLAIIRLYASGRSPFLAVIRYLIVFYADFFRCVPHLVIIVVIFFALPYVGVSLSPIVTTVLGVGMVLSAFAEEVFWAAIIRVPKGQWEAGRSSGLSYGRVLFVIILPQAAKMSIAPLTNRSLAASKATTLGSVIAVPDLLSVTSSIQSAQANPTALTVGALLFVALFMPIVWLCRVLERRTELP